MLNKLACVDDSRLKFSVSFSFLNAYLHLQEVQSGLCYRSHPLRLFRSIGIHMLLLSFLTLLKIIISIYRTLPNIIPLLGPFSST